MTDYDRIAAAIRYIDANSGTQPSLDEVAAAVGSSAYHLSGLGRLHDRFVVLEGVTPGEYRSGGAGVRIDDAAPHADVDVDALREAWPASELQRDDGLASRVVSAIFAGERPPLHVSGTNVQVRGDPEGGRGRRQPVGPGAEAGHAGVGGGAAGMSVGGA
jgi:hypothetical protein